MSFDEAMRFAVSWVAAWNQHDPDAILAHYADDVEWTSPFVATLIGGESSTLRGKTAARAYIERGRARYPELVFELLRVFTGVGSITIRYRSVGSLEAAEVFELDPMGRVRRVLCHYGA